MESYDLVVRPDDAFRESERLFGADNQITPAYVRKTLLWKGQIQRARQIVDDALSKIPDDPFLLSQRALIQALMGDARSAEADVLKVVERGRSGRAFHHLTYNVACIYALQSKSSEAVKWLRTTVDTGMPNYTLFSRDPHLDKIRKDPGFIQFMSELKPRFEKYQQEFR